MCRVHESSASRWKNIARNAISERRRNRGRYELLSEDGPAALADGKLEIRFFGGRLRGEWHMVKLKGRDNKKEWLLSKARDRYARAKDEAVVGLDLTFAERTPTGRFLTWTRPPTTFLTS